MRAARLAFPALLALAACDGASGTFTVSLVTAPGSQVLDNVVTARLVLSAPRTVVESSRAADGSFALSLDVDASGAAGTLLFEGVDTSGAILAVGETPPLPIAAVDAAIRIYVAAPRSFAAAPVALTAPRAEVATASLAYGELIAGGVDSSGAASADVVIYNAYTHDFQVGVPLPAARAGASAFGGTSGAVYLFGGDDPAGAPTSTFWRYDTTVAPAGAVTALATSDALARTGAATAAIGSDRALVTGAPPALLDGLGGAASALPAPAPAAIGGAIAPLSISNQLAVIFTGAAAGSTGVTLYTTTGFSELAAPDDARRTGHGLAVTGLATAVLVGGGVAGSPLTPDLLVVNAEARAVSSVPGVLLTPRRDAAIALTGDLIVVAGGTDESGNVLGDAELIDVTTLSRSAVIPLTAPRTGAIARVLPSGQVLL
ncbi:MAG: hypothetical protein K8W52_38180, partial [Deltaproteobacteria bacterium]|nr:hypothetical protein [Deltaproteobacteria bacterium]